MNMDMYFDFFDVDHSAHEEFMFCGNSEVKKTGSNFFSPMLW
jgi:hypothetical protein